MEEVTTVTTVAETVTETVTEYTIGASDSLNVAMFNTLHNDIEIASYLLGLIVVLLIGGWLYSFFKDLFNNC